LGTLTQCCIIDSPVMCLLHVHNRAARI